MAVGWDYADSLALLSSDEMLRFKRLRFDRDRKLFVGRRAFLRRLVALWLDLDPKSIAFGYGPFGKPFLADFPGFDFNLSFSGNHVIFAFTEDTPLGVDVEEIMFDIEYQRIADHFFAREEIDQLALHSTGEVPKAFYRCWTRKEAIIKARGDGLNYPLRDFAVSLVEDASILAFHDQRERREDWHLHNLPARTDGLVMALAYKGPNRKIIPVQ